MLTHLSLFSGIGGLDLAAEWAGFTTVGQCEWADYPTKVLEKHWPDVERWRDIHDLSADEFYRRTGRKEVTVLSGGFPCQPHSLSGKREASNDERDLWPEYMRIVREVNPRWVVGENVRGLLSSENGQFFGRVLRDLAEWGGVVYGGIAFRPMQLEHRFGVSVSQLWPRPIASDGLAWTKLRKSDPMISIWKSWKNCKQDRPIYYHIWNDLTPCQSIDILEMMMGFPKSWTDLSA
jgi:hypothetical protein